MLSPRQIHFTGEQIVFECMWHETCETFPEAFLPVYDGCNHFSRKRAILDINRRTDARILDPDQLKQKYLALGDYELTSKIIHEIHQAWEELISEYTLCELMYASDKLIAISGLAQLVQAAVDDTYLAGLWKSQLPFQLLWYVKSHTRRSGQLAARPKPLRVPTWTWGSIDAHCD
jgi:hypothetical protein